MRLRLYERVLLGWHHIIALWHLGRCNVYNYYSDYTAQTMLKLRRSEESLSALNKPHYG